MNYLKLLTVVLLLPFLMFAFGCDDKPINELSPTEVVDLYFEARDSGDTVTLEQVIYFPIGFSQKEIDDKISAHSAGSDEKAVSRAVGMDFKTEYEKFIDDTTAEVGVVIYMGILGAKNRVPFQQIILKKDNGIWKYGYSTHDLTEEQLIVRIRNNPYDASAIYLLGSLYQPKNPARANRYYKKYLELEPHGFWKDENLMRGINEMNDIKSEESSQLQALQNVPEDSVGRSVIYIKLCKMYIEHGDYNQSQIYLDKAQIALETSSSPNSPMDIEDIEITKKALRQAMQGTDDDILKELEAKGVYQNP